VNVSKAALEGAFADELALLQPSAGYMRLVKDRILYVWEQRRAEAKEPSFETEMRSAAAGGWDSAAATANGTTAAGPCARVPFGLVAGDRARKIGPA
jgi:hypothetical protein